MVVFPALSRPRTRIRASLFPNSDENSRVKTIPISPLWKNGSKQNSRTLLFFLRIMETRVTAKLYPKVKKQNAVIELNTGGKVEGLPERKRIIERVDLWIWEVMVVDLLLFWKNLDLLLVPSVITVEGSNISPYWFIQDSSWKFLLFLYYFWWVKIIEIWISSEIYTVHEIWSDKATYVQ